MSMSHAADGHLHPYIQGSLEEIFQEQDRYAMRVRWNGRLFQVSAAQVFAPSLQAALLLSHHLPVEISLINAMQKGEGLLLDLAKQAYFVLEPNWLINVTTLTQLDYCKRTYLNQRFSIRKTNRFLIKGSVIHAVFEDILKNHTDHEALRQKMSNVLNSYALEFAFLDLNIEELESDIREHLNRLYLYRKQKLKKISKIFTERYLIDNRMGLKGKIDAVVEYEDGSLQALELKTGKGWGAFAKRGHAFQAQAYSLMLQMKFPEKRILAPVIIYSGEDKKAEFLTRRVAMSYADTVNLMNMRNELIAADLTGRLDFQRDERRCARCSNRFECEFLAELCHGEGVDAKVFNVYVKAMLEEYSLIKRTQGRYFAMNAQERMKQGRCLQVFASEKGDDTSELILFCENNSELREGDRCLLSDAEGPLGPHCVECVLSHVEHDRVGVTLAQPVTELWFRPEYLDIHSSETLFEVNFAGFIELFRNAGLRDLLKLLHQTHAAGPCQPAFSGVSHVPDACCGEVSCAEDDLSASQRQVIQRSLEDERHLLVQGPPGTGKTYTIARMIHALRKAGKRVMVACFTHRAVEEVCLKLMAAAPDLEFYCLGFISNLNGQIPCLEQVISGHATVNGRMAVLKDLAARNPVYVATTHAWFSGRYDALATEELFDVAIVDEAGQLLLPQTIGAVRLARRFVLVGDHRQLPPVVQSPRAGLLKETLFELMLKHSDSAVNKLMLTEQFRMPEPVADLISREFYEGRLVSAPVCTVDRGALHVPDGGMALHGVNNLLECLCTSPLVLMDVPSPSCMSGATAKQNLHEVNAVIGVLTALNFNGACLEIEGKRPPLGIIAPFRSQVAALRKAVQRHFGVHLSGPFEVRAMVDTVDRFQGDERDVMLLSLCIPNGELPELYADARRLNVAVSRARKQLIAIGDWQLAENLPVLASFKENALKQKGCLYIDRESCREYVFGAGLPGLSGRTNAHQF
jgi:DNA replication ATP-dependent helicase Dna2